MASDPGFAATGASEPAEVALAHAWGEALAALLPPGLDPRTPGMAEILARVAAEASEAASGLASLLARISAICGSEDVAALERLADAAARSRRLEQARSRVTRADAWDLVSRLEEEGIEPSLWGDAARGLSDAPHPVEAAAPVAEIIPVTQDGGRLPALPGPVPPSAFPFPEPAAWSRTLLRRTGLKAA